MCDETYTAFGMFKDAWDEAKREGWRCFENDVGEWEHRCPQHVRRQES
jgi:hypothetical protein